MPRGRPTNATLPLPHHGTEKAPPCPRAFNKEERAVWKNLVKRLQASNTISLADPETMASYCTTVARLQATEQILRQQGANASVMPLKNADGDIVNYATNPFLKIAIALKREMMQLSRALGLDMKGRKSLDTPAPKVPVDDPKARFFKARMQA